MRAGRSYLLRARRGLALGVAVALVALAAVLVPALGSSTGQAASPVTERAFRSKALKAPLRFAVSLPPGYARGGRYPVIYFLHGLPATATSFRDIGFLRRALDQVARQAIVVAPQGARDGDPDPEYIDWGEGRNWETALAQELPAYVDRTFRTIPGRQGRALVGISAGGYGALLVGLHNLDTFSAIESWSGYTSPTDPEGTTTLDLGSPAANLYASASAMVRRLQQAPGARPTFLGFYVGTQDTLFRPANVRLDAQLRDAGVPHLFRLYPGGHDQVLWSAHASEWLGLALARLAPAVGVPPA